MKKKYGMFKIVGAESEDFIAYVEYIENPFVGRTPENDTIEIIGEDIITGSRVIKYINLDSLKGICKMKHIIANKLVIKKDVIINMSKKDMLKNLESLTYEELCDYADEVEKIKETYQNKIEDLKNETDRALTKRLNSTKKRIRNKLKCGE